MRVKIFCCLLLVMVAGANADGAWKWGDSSNSPPSTDSPTSADVGEQVDTKEAAPAEEGVSIDEATDAIITSTRTGKVINSYGAIYEDPSVQEALKSGNDTEARTYIKSKLCNLGLAKECAKLLAKGKTYGYGGPSLGIDPLSVSYVQPVQLVASGPPIAAVPLGGGIGGYKNLKANKGHFKSGYGVPNVGLGLPPLNTYGAPTLGNSYGTPPLSLTGGLGLAPPIGGGLGFAPPIGGGLGLGHPPLLTSPHVPIPPPVQNIQHVHHHLYDNKKAIPYSPPAPVYTKTPVYNPPAPAHIRPPTPVYNPAPPAYNPAPPAYNPAPPAYNPAPPAYNPTRPSYSPSQQTPAYSNPSPSYSGLNGRDTCVCVPIQQCPSYDIVGRVNDYQLDPRNVKSNITAAEDDLPEKSRRRRQAFERRRGEVRQTIVGDDSITVVSSDSTSPDSPSVPSFSPAPTPSNPDVSNSDSTNTDASTPIIGVPIPEGNGEGLLGSTPTAENVGLFQTLRQTILPTLGISFGLPGGAFGSYPVNPLGNNPLVNQFGGPIGGDGVDLGAVNVNPLVSLQLAKNEKGDKIFRPLINFHITPSRSTLGELGLNDPTGFGGQNIGGQGFGASGFGGQNFGGAGSAGFRKGETGLYNDDIGIANTQFIGSNSLASEFNSKVTFRDTRSTDSLAPTAGEGARHGLIKELKALKHAYGKGSYGFGGGYPVADPYPVPYPVPVPQAVPVPRPYAVPTPVDVPVPVYIPVKVPKPYAVHVPVGVPTPVHVAQPYAVPVPVHHPVPVPQPYSVPVAVPQPFPVPQPYSVPVGVPHPYPVADPYPVPVEVPHPVPVPQPYYGPTPHISESYANFHHPGDEGNYGSSYSSPVGPSPSYPAPSYPAPSYPAPSYPAQSYQAPSYPAQSYPAPSYPVQPHREPSYPQQPTHDAQGYDSITVTASNHQYSYRDAGSLDHPTSDSSGSSVRFIDSRSDEGEEDVKTSSSVTFRNEKRKRSVPQVETVERDARQLGGGGYQTCGYQEVCCRSQKPNQYSNIPTAGTCGRRNPSGITGRIKTPVHIDGEAEFGEYPWQVAILKKDQYDNVYVCGGALVGPSHVITAAHCIKGNQAIDLRVRLGEWDVNRESEFYPHVEKDVSSILIHPEFYQGNLYNDIALVKFDGFVDFQRNPHISQACLPPKYQEFAGSRCWVTGWGKDAFGTGGKYQNILKEVDVPVVNNFDCENKLRRTRLGYDFKLDSGFMCAGGEEGKDACKGDGGGPLVCEHQGQWYLSGIVSWGIGCGQYDVPGVYTKVSQYTDWVQKNMFN